MRIAPSTALWLSGLLAACAALPPADFSLDGAVRIPAGQLELRTCSPPAYPATAIGKGEAGVVEVLVLIAPRGKVSGARIVRSSGYPEMDRAVLESMSTCFFPALADGGVPTNRYAVLRETFKWPLRYRN